MVDVLHAQVGHLDQAEEGVRGKHHCEPVVVRVLHLQLVPLLQEPHSPCVTCVGLKNSNINIGNLIS